jgi:hypothetical protein
VFRQRQKSSRSYFGRQHFDRNLLPSAEGYFRALFGPLRFNGSGWAMVSCPVHGPEKTPSLSIHKDGGWRCFSCDEKGDDILSFEMFRSCCDFKQAAKTLGAWRS